MTKLLSGTSPFGRVVRKYTNTISSATFFSAFPTTSLGNFTLRSCSKKVHKYNLMCSYNFTYSSPVGETMLADEQRKLY